MKIGMFKDIENSRTLKERWDQYISRVDPENYNEMELECKVLTTGFWPFAGKQPCNLPQVLLDECEKFRTFYLQYHSGRRLTFDPSRGGADIYVDFDG